MRRYKTQKCNAIVYPSVTIANCLRFSRLKVDKKSTSFFFALKRITTLFARELESNKVIVCYYGITMHPYDVKPTELLVLCMNLKRKSTIISFEVYSSQTVTTTETIFVYKIAQILAMDN